MFVFSLLYDLFLAYSDGRVEEVKLRHCNTSEGLTKIVKTFRSVAITGQLLRNMNYLYKESERCFQCGAEARFL